MKPLSGLILIFTLLVVSAQFAAITPASAITAELARKCLEEAYKLYPPQRAGTKGGNTREVQKYYKNCITKGTSEADKKSQGSQAKPAR